MNREQYKAHVKALADAAISKTLEHWHRDKDPALGLLMDIESHEISAHEVVKADPWFKKPRNWPVIFRETYHRPIAEILIYDGKPEFMPKLAYCALLQDVIRTVEYKLSWLREQGADLRNFLPTAVL